MVGTFGGDVGLANDKLELLNAYKIKATNAQPVGEYTKKELEKLEHVWRLQLKSQGFDDIEKWGTNTKYKRRRMIKFIKGHIRKSSCYHRKYTEQLVLSKKNLRNIHEAFWRAYDCKFKETFEYYRIIGIFAHHAPDSLLPNYYRLILQNYAQVGLQSEAIRMSNTKVTENALQKFLKKNMPKIIAFTKEYYEGEE